ncbi:MAG: NAD(P)H-dependent oxidoreductase subunit E [Planctomycetes bacterium]|nr:NAD(P)H-dependent oxidoreductase subunit E [Planctomycetota bacterium]
MEQTTERQLSAEATARIEELVTRFPKKDGALLNVFRIIEKEFGYLDPAAVALAAKFCEMPKAKAWGVYTFYSTFKNEKDGKHELWVCSTLPCALRGSEALYDHLKGVLDLNDYGTTTCGTLTLKKAECIGACGTAPCFQLDADYYENMTPDNAERVVKDLLGGNPRPAGFTPWE